MVSGVIYWLCYSKFRGDAKVISNVLTYLSEALSLPNAQVMSPVQKHMCQQKQIIIMLSSQS